MFFRALVETLLAGCGAEVIVLALIVALELGVLSHFHAAYRILHIFTHEYNGRQWQSMQ